MIAYWGMGLYWGKASSNNKKGHMIGHIKVNACVHYGMLRLLCVSVVYCSCSAVSVLPSCFNHG